MIENKLIWVFVCLLFATAFLYSSAGHGGASGYLALMSLFGFEPSVMKSSSLILNIFVSLIAFYQFYKGGFFKWNLFLPFIITSIPLSFIGAYIVIDAALYKKILGVLLLFPILRLVGLWGKDEKEIKKLQWIPALFIGGIIGFLSGMIGIGGGILLSPIILILHWADLKQTAAISALFIFINSISGLIGILYKGTVIDNSIYLWVPVAIAGGAAGAYFATKKFNNKILKLILATVLTIASIKLLTVDYK